MTAEAPPLEDLAQSIIPIAQRAGAAILDIYCSNPNTRYKADQSPVTDADHASEDLILDSLSKLFPQIPVVAEESLAAGNIPEIQRYFFVVDPLDGTKEFIKKNGEFTVNIALVDADQPVFGLIYAPDKADCYVTLGGNRAARCELLPDRNPATRQMFDFQILTGDSQAQRPMTAIVSRSHLTPETERFLQKLGDPPRLFLGSSLKFGVIARGDADVYPRFGQTSEWDTAAGHALLNAAGGCLLMGDGEPFLYGKKDRNFVNPPFVAWRRTPNFPVS
ncbi:MAG: 3'(2'),5'-bisphosphate nucleotidase CysQ [Rhodomicrobium sp.]